MMRGKTTISAHLVPALNCSIPKNHFTPTRSIIIIDICVLHSLTQDWDPASIVVFLLDLSTRKKGAKALILGKGGKTQNVVPSYKTRGTDAQHCT